MSVGNQRRQSVVGSTSFVGHKHYQKREYVTDSEAQQILNPFSIYFSNWQLIITNEVEGKWFRKAEYFRGNGAASSELPTTKPCHGVYEIAIAHSAIHSDSAYAEYIPVYVGSTNQLRTRILHQYGNDGSKLGYVLRPYLQLGFQVYFRWAYSPNKTTTLLAESALLNMFDYSMAKSQNPPYRDAIWTPLMRVDGATVRMVAFVNQKVSTLRNLSEIATLIKQEAAEAELLLKKALLEKEIAEKQAEHEAELDRLQKATAEAADSETRSESADPTADDADEEEIIDDLLLRFYNLSCMNKEKFKVLIAEFDDGAKPNSPTSNEVDTVARLTSLVQAIPSLATSTL